MLNLEYVDPKDVLRHLNSLGYHNITSQQLKEFLHDLKKLIKYEQKHALQSCVETKSACIHSSECECSYPEYDDNSDISCNNESCQESFASSRSTSATYNRNDQKFNTNIRHSIKTLTEAELPQTAHTSFIRPWNLQASRDLSSRGKKNLDPVSLYHQYKKFWKKQSIPGETKHAELRWNIRNRMLGQEPHPRIFNTNYKPF